MYTRPVEVSRVCERNESNGTQASPCYCIFSGRRRPKAREESLNRACNSFRDDY